MSSRQSKAPRRRARAKGKRRSNGGLASGEAKYTPPSRSFSLPGGQFAPPSLRTTLRWGFRGTGAASGTYGETVFSGNGLFDPGLAASASQPVSFDQYSIWYAFYRVLASRIRVKCIIHSTSATPTSTSIAGELYLFPSTTASAGASQSEVLAQPFTKVAQFDNGKSAVLALSMPTSKILGIKIAGYDSAVSALVTANPSTQWYWHVGTASGGYTSVETVLDVSIEYDVEFYGRQYLALSTLLAGFKYTRQLQIAEAKAASDRPTVHLRELDLPTSKDLSASTAPLEPTLLDRKQALLRQTGMNPRAQPFTFGGQTPLGSSAFDVPVESKTDFGEMKSDSAFLNRPLPLRKSQKYVLVDIEEVPPALTTAPRTSAKADGVMPAPVLTKT